ncbi:HAMP domain-containing sensor histidine kinase [Clostridium sp. OS1-26]|uniref:sensor histidine kinase n=1 Tax=Clostridium sp. OS1-26 TaxID=3070681 RepID=UPI0027E0AB4F|nr:HAMP domain-containing sensor histidine kinase [Clostridium sp. OS1-26]WML32902.1 HAMP domain-containing sensor histidine kinase [Clostridium sp. OS1-26]
MLDTKLKNSKSKYIINIIILLVLLASSVGMYSTYPIIKEGSKKYEENVFERGGFFSSYIANSNYCIYVDILNKKENKDIEPSNILLNLDKKYDNYTQESVEVYKDTFNKEISEYKRNLDEGLKNLEYYAIEKDSKLVLRRSQDGINSLIEDNVVINPIEQSLNKKYSFYIVIDYDNQGNRTIKKLYGADMLSLSNQFKNDEANIRSALEIKPIKNMTYVYAIPKELKYKDLIFSHIENSERYSYQNKLTFCTIIAFFICIAIVAFMTPYKISKELIGFKKIAKLPIEIIGFVIFMISLLTCAAPELITISIINKELPKLLPIDVSQELVYRSINILYWFICFGAAFVSIIIIKHIFKTGIREYIKGNSLIYKILRSIWRASGRVNKKFCGYLRNIDLKEKNTKKLAILLGINLIIVSIISCFWFLGIIVAVIYTVILFVIVRKHYNNISSKYNKLLEAANKIAEGNLDIIVEDDLGVFNAFKKEIESIQKGFKKAVNEEVKSQRMKTELITNVSHDLKTPLTAIITYVDLLKDENLSVEKRKEYLNTLDRKSQRLQELIEDLFEVSKATSGNINLNIVDVDVVDLMKQTLLELDDKILKASLIIKTNYPKSKIILHLDSQRIFRVFENLIINITKYAMKGSRVYIDIVSKEDKVEITLKNMAANEIDFNVDEIAERFVRGDKARTADGSGLGLAIAKSFVELQGGELNISVDGDLFKVTITFPK